MIEFRPLKAEEIECRIGQISRNGNGLSILLYKDARSDANILDEVLGIENWQCSYEQVGGQLFCTVKIWSEDKLQWISKQDVGTPSNMEAEKGRASDAFKRACFRLGVGRELYTAPRIWIYGDSCKIVQGQNGKFQCYDDFSVEKIDISNHRIVYLAIRNDTLGRTVFAWAAPESQDTREGTQANVPTQEQMEQIAGLVDAVASTRNVDNDTVMGYLMRSKAVTAAGIVDGNIRTYRQAETVIGQLRTWAEKG